MKKHLVFELDDDSILVDTEDEVEFDHKYNQEETKLIQAQLAWYIIENDSILAKTQSFLVEILTLIQMFITPLVLVFTEVKEVMIVPQLVFDSIWCIGIIMNFIIADKVNFTFKKIATKYICSGRFFIDLLSTLPAMITLEQMSAVQFCKFLRLIYF